jgi:hypothetical protein
MLNTLNPIKEETPDTDKYIKLISLFLIGLFFYQLYKEFGLIQFMFFSEDGKWDFSMVICFLPMIALPTAAILFWMKKRFGWTLAAICFSYSVTGAVILLVKEFNRKPSGVPALDTLFPVTLPSVYFGTMILFGGMLWLICKNCVRDIYKINKPMMYLTAGAAT